MSRRPSAANARFETTRPADQLRPHAGDSGAELAIFVATERLLAKIPLQELSVAQIIHGAGVSRPTFYFYFSSKYAVVTGLLARVMDEIYDVIQPFIRGHGDTVAELPLREGLTVAAEVWSRHRASLRAVIEHRHAVPELGTLWLDVVNRFASGLAADIDRERKAGRAADGLDSRMLGSALIWGSERCFHVAGLGVDEDFPNEQAIVEPLLALWLGTIYGTGDGGGSNLPASVKRKPSQRGVR